MTEYYIICEEVSDDKYMEEFLNTEPPETAVYDPLMNRDIEDTSLYRF